MRQIGFSTGALAHGDFKRALAMLRDVESGPIELSALRENELLPLIQHLGSLDLSPFTYISVHAPSKYEYLREPEVVALLGEVAARDWHIVLHPDAIWDFDVWNSFGPLLLIENMDKRNISGRTACELSDIFARLPQAGLCFDIGHCRQVDPTMNESYLILREFGNRLTQLHMSEVNSRSTHDPLSCAAIAAFEKVACLVPERIPVILESPVRDKEIEEEIERARLALPSSGNNPKVKTAIALQKALA